MFELPEVPKAKLTEFNVNQYDCLGCGRKVSGRDSGIPKQGRYGPNFSSWVIALNKWGRLPIRRTADFMRVHGVEMTHSSVANIVHRSSKWFKGFYESVKMKIQESEVLYVDETPLRIKGTPFYAWVMRSPENKFFVIDQRRNKDVLDNILKGKFKGVIVVMV